MDELDRILIKMTIQKMAKMGGKYCRAYLYEGPGIRPIKIYIRMAGDGAPVICLN